MNIPTPAEIDAARAATTRAEYDAIPALNQSKARLFLTNPKKAAHALANPKPPTAAMTLGIHAHRAALEPEKFSELVVVPENAPRRPTKVQINAKKPSEETLAAIKFWTEFDAANPPESIIDADEKAKCLAIAESFNSLIADYGIKPIAYEVALSGEYLIPIKGQLDIIAEDGYIYDLKTTSQDATEEDWGKNLKWDKGLQMQMAWYYCLFKIAFGYAPAGFRHIVIETEAPYDGRIFEADPELRGYGTEAMIKAIDAYRDYCDGFVPGYPRTIAKISLAKKAESANALTFA